MICTFYSYKGGVGRTHLLANLAAYLCYYKKRKVLIIDWDLEAPGTHFYFNTKENPVKTGKGLIDLLNAHIKVVKNVSELNEENFVNPTPYISPLVSTHQGQIDLIPAIDYKEGYHAQIADFDWIQFYDKLYGGVYLEWLKDQLKSKYDFIFIDSRTGLNDYSGICNVLMPDLNVIVSAPNEQSYEGAKHMANRIINSPYTQKGYRKPLILPILSKVDNTLGERADEWKERFVKEFAFTLTPLLEEDIRIFNEPILDLILAKTILWYNSDFSIGEKIRFNEKAKSLSASAFMKHFENIGCDFLDELKDNQVLDLNSIISANDWFNIGYNATDSKNEILAYNKALLINPNHSEALNNRGAAKQKLTDYEGAIKDCDKVIFINPNDATALNNRGVAKFNLKDYKGAVEDYNKAILANPNSSIAFHSRGIAKRELGDLNGAIEDFNKAISINPNNAEVLNHRGVVKQKLNASKITTIINPNNTTNLNNKGNLEDYKRAIKDYNKATVINPNYAKAFYNQGTVKQKLGNYKEAIEDFSKAISINSNHKNAFNNRGTAKFLLEDYLGAIEDFNKAIQINPDYTIPYFNKVCAYNCLNNKPQVLKSLQKVIELDSIYKKKAQTDPDLKNLWNDPDFQKLVQ